MAVVLNDVYYSHENKYKSNYVLNGVNMNIPIGSIYGLIGPSGCGKTTLLKCIIGLLRPISGHVFVFGFRPGDERSGVPGAGVGYMPQELAIQYDLTIEEILKYFGKINCMEKYQLENEIEFLVKILELNDKHQLCGNLSGGQKRRVSFAIAMLHKPRLLILDEPTVGVDPILSQNIWGLMQTLSTTLRTTIIITTHYIDETKRTDFVGLMRKGEILEENTPKLLLNKYDSHNLDEVFLKICYDHKDRRNSEIVSRKSSLKYKKGGVMYCEKLPFNRPNVTNFEKSYEALLALIWKYLIETRRNPFAVFILLFSTMSVIVAVNLFVGRTPTDLPIAWVVDDVKHNNHEKLTFVNTSLEQFGNFSNSENEAEYEFNDQLYLPNILKQSINAKILKLIDYPNISHALSDAKKRVVYAVIHLKQNFSQNYLDSDSLFAETDDFIDSEIIHNGSIHLHLDFADLVIANTIKSVILESIQLCRQQIAAHFELNPLLVSSAVEMHPINAHDKPIKSIEDIFSVATFITPGFISFTSFSACVSLAILSLLTEKECDMFVRNYSSGITAIQVVFSQIMARFIVSFLNAFLNLLAMVYILGVPCRGSVWLIIALQWLQMFLGLSFGTLLSSLMTNSYFSFYTSLAATNVLLATNGIIWGIESQPYYFKWFMPYSPLFYSVTSLRSLLFYSNTPSELVWPGFLFTILWTVIATLASIIIISRKK